MPVLHVVEWMWLQVQSCTNTLHVASLESERSLFELVNIVIFRGCALGVQARCNAACRITTTHAASRPLSQTVDHDCVHVSFVTVIVMVCLVGRPMP